MEIFLTFHFVCEFILLSMEKYIFEHFCINCRYHNTYIGINFMQKTLQKFFFRQEQDSNLRTTWVLDNTNCNHSSQAP